MAQPILPYSAYFEYVALLKGQSYSEAADRWLLSEFTTLAPDAVFWDFAPFLGQINTKNSGLVVTMPLVYEGFEFDRVEKVPGQFYWHFQRLLAEDTGKAMRIAINTCFCGRAVGEQEFRPISEISERLTFFHAEALTRSFMSFFSRLP
jgi:hypothetical protein